MNNILTDPIGIDAKIQTMQILLYDKLDWANIEMYGRVFKNKVDGKVIAQGYGENANGDYKKDVYLDDTKNASIFFVAADNQTTTNGVQFTNEVKIVFMLNLKVLYPDINHRADTEAQNTAYDLVHSRKAFRIKRIETGLENVLNGFDVSLKSLIRSDLQPIHVFGIVADVNYKMNSNCLKN